MTKILVRRFSMSILFLFLCIISSWAYSAKQAILLEITDTIGPATQEYIQHHLISAQKNPEISFVILRLDTPGGVNTAVRSINKTILASTIPIITYVSPSGARAANLAAFIVYASHIAAMAPGTNIGATIPVEKNNIKDAIAYLRNLAQLRERNVDWPEKAVDGNVNLSAEDALKLKVIDVVADNIPDLMQKLNDRTVTVQGTPMRLDTRDVNIKTIKPGIRFTLLSYLTDPTIAYLLLLIAIYGLFLEFYHPGFIIPGILGAISLLLTLYSFQFLPINYAGITLLLAGIVCILTEASLSKISIFTVLGIVTFALGSYFFIHTNEAENKIAWQLILATSVITAVFFQVIIRISKRASRSS